ncbi:MAG: hypothetical protein Q9195_000227 [Heterodermia aff. obscurata]
MPSVRARLDFLADIPLYQDEKPYVVLLSVHEKRDPDQRLNNLEWEVHEVRVTDIRGLWDTIDIDRCGFQAIRHKTASLGFDSMPDLHAYQKETEMLLKERYPSSHIVCYELKLRENTRFERDMIDLNDPFLVEGPAKGVHNGGKARSFEAKEILM